MLFSDSLYGDAKTISKKIENVLHGSLFLNDCPKQSESTSKMDQIKSEFAKQLAQHHGPNSYYKDVLTIHAKIRNVRNACLGLSDRPGQKFKKKGK